MYLICGKENNVFIAFGEHLSYIDEVNPHLIDENIVFPYDAVDVFEVDSIPEEVSRDEYCYTKKKGFYKNPNWVEPNKYGLPNEVVNQIIDDTIMELIEQGVIE